MAASMSEDESRGKVDRNSQGTVPETTGSVRRLHAVEDADMEGLVDVLIDCVEGGASVSFMHPLSRESAVTFWRRVAQGVRLGERALLVAEDAQGMCGTVQLTLALPENQPHRADVSKMLVHRRARRQGLGAALMRAAEATARECGKTLLVSRYSYGKPGRAPLRTPWLGACRRHPPLRADADGRFLQYDSILPRSFERYWA
jgi:GNAT superfamily N-acetyltransferase